MEWEISLKCILQFAHRTKIFKPPPKQYQPKRPKMLWMAYDLNTSVETSGRKTSLMGQFNRAYRSNMHLNIMFWWSKHIFPSTTRKFTLFPNFILFLEEYLRLNLFSWSQTSTCRHVVIHKHRGLSCKRILSHEILVNSSQAY